MASCAPDVLVCELCWSVRDGPGTNDLLEVLKGVTTTACTVEEAAAVAVAVAAVAAPGGFLGAITENDVETEVEDGVAMVSVEMERRLKLLSLSEGDACENEGPPVQPGVKGIMNAEPSGLIGEM